MFLQIITAIISLGDTFKIIKDFVDLLTEQNLKRQEKEINDRAKARNSARAILIESLKKAEDNETRSLLATNLYNFNKLSDS